MGDETVFFRLRDDFRDPFGILRGVLLKPMLDRP